MEEKKLIGKVLYYYSKISVAVIKILNKIEMNDEISIEGITTNLRQKVESMEMDTSLSKKLSLAILLV